MNERNRRLSGRIAQLLRAGTEVSGDLLAYIDATFSTPSVQDLERILADESDPEREGLLELIFFPDEKMQRQLEELLPPVDGLEPCDVEAVADDLAGRRLQTVLTFPDRPGPLTVDFPPRSMMTFLGRLNLTRRIEPRLAQAIAALDSPADRQAARVKVRNSRKPPGDGQILFLSALVDKLGRNDRFLACLDFALGFLEDLDEGADIYSALMDRRRIGWQLLQKSTLFEEKLKRDNIETLMLRGERMTHVSRDELLQTIALIEQIGWAVFGRLDPLGFHPQDGTAVALELDADPSEIIRRLL